MNTTTAHQWVVEEGQCGLVVTDSEGIFVAGIGHRQNEEEVAHLIAAAPQMLEALRKLTFMARTSGGTPGPDAGLMDACQQAEWVIAAATGATK